LPARFFTRECFCGLGFFVGEAVDVEALGSVALDVPTSVPLLRVLITRRPTWTMHVRLTP